MSGTHFKKGVAAGAKNSATVLTLTKKSTVSVTVAAITAGAEADVDVTIAGAQVGDSVVIAPRDAAAETGIMWNAWVSAANTVTIRMTNASGSTLTGSTSNWDYLLISSASQ
jgi:hypothetical protein